MAIKTDSGCEQLPLLNEDMPPGPTVASYGMGVDSSALLVGLVQRGMRPDMIIFADVGDEKPATYDYEPVMQEYLRREGFPPITTVRYTPKNFKNFPPYFTLSENCLTNASLPGISFGRASCSLKWKVAPQGALIKKWEPARIAWATGKRVIKLIGFDDSPRDRIRTYTANPADRNLYEYRTPLQEWHWDREECKRQIRLAGLKVPCKSSCFMCLAMKPDEIRELPKEYLRKIVRIEARADSRLTKVEGLWRTTVKGTRGGTPRPGSMTQFIRQENLLDPAEIDHIWQTTPLEIIRYMEGYAKAKAEGRLDEYPSCENGAIEGVIPVA